MKTRRRGQSEFQLANVRMDIEEKALEEHNLNLQNDYLREMEKSQIKSQDSGKYYRSNILIRAIIFFHSLFNFKVSKREILNSRATLLLRQRRIPPLMKSSIVITIFP